MAEYSYGSGPGCITDDGCAVEYYRQLPELSDLGIFLSNVAPGSTILDLGAGAGRLANPLVRAGYKVTAVDQSSAMLDYVVSEAKVESKIENLDLNIKFDCVLLSSYLLNVPCAKSRRALLDTCCRHVAREGVVLIEVHNKALLKMPETRVRSGENWRDEFRVHNRTDDVITFSITSTFADRTWVQQATQEYLSQERLKDELRSAGLNWLGWADEKEQWLKADCVTQNVVFHPEN